MAERENTNETTDMVILNDRPLGKRIIAQRLQLFGSSVVYARFCAHDNTTSHCSNR
jgi:hypothetical protein